MIFGDFDRIHAFRFLGVVLRGHGPLSDRRCEVAFFKPGNALIQERRAATSPRGAQWGGIIKRRGKEGK